MGFLKEILFPKFCLGCGLVGRYFCLNCLKKLEIYKNQHCFFCKKPSKYGLTHDCCLKKLPINGFFSFLKYNSFLKKIIKDIKYRLSKDIFIEFLNICYSYFINDLSFYKKLFLKGEIQSIPLSKNRLKIRGFNQSQIFSQFLSQYLNLPLVNYLERKKDTPYLAQIKDKKKRYLAIRGAFKLRGDFNLVGKKIILIDDIITTGTTVRESVKILKRARVDKIFVLTLAR